MKKLPTNNFNRVAPFYDVLSRVVYFNAQRNVQEDQLKYLQPGAVVLIVGGGSGWILESIAARYSGDLHIVYVEVSERMITYAKRRKVPQLRVDFVHADIEAYNGMLLFDAVLTPFLFDNFLAPTAARVFKKIDSMLKEGGFWLSSDFSLEKPRGHWWKLLLTKTMYIFFKAFGIVEGNKLIDIDRFFSEYKYGLICKQFYYNGFIKGSVFQKTS